jgi:hypothetical protein
VKVAPHARRVAVGRHVGEGVVAVGELAHGRDGVGAEPVGEVAGVGTGTVVVVGADGDNPSPALDGECHRAPCPLVVLGDGDDRSGVAQPVVGPAGKEPGGVAQLDVHGAAGWGLVAERRQPVVHAGRAAGAVDDQVGGQAFTALGQNDAVDAPSSRGERVGPGLDHADAGQGGHPPAQVPLQERPRAGDTGADGRRWLAPAGDPPLAVHAGVRHLGAGVSQLGGQAGEHRLQALQPPGQKAVDLVALGHAPAGDGTAAEVVPLDEDDLRGVVGQHPRRQHAGHAATEYHGPVH